MYRGPSLRSSFGDRARRSPPVFKVAATIILAGIVGVGTMGYKYETSEATTQRVTVTDKDRHVSSEGGGKYMVFTDKEVFENTDSMLRDKMDSSDVQAQLHVGCTYDITAYGFRNNWFSIYRNISAAEHVKTETCPVNKPPMRGM